MQHGERIQHRFGTFRQPDRRAKHVKQGDRRAVPTAVLLDHVQSLPIGTSFTVSDIASTHQQVSTAPGPMSGVSAPIPRHNTELVYACIGDVMVLAILLVLLAGATAAAAEVGNGEPVRVEYYMEALCP